jgi:hypothetical protein
MQNIYFYSAALAWFTFVLAFFILFCVSVVYFEIDSAWKFCRNRSDADKDNWKSILKRCFMLRQIHNYSGQKWDMFVARSAFHTTEDTEVVDLKHVYESTHRESWSIWTRFTKTYLGAFFEELDPPQRLYTLDDVNDYRPFMTKNTWR